jgi:hypothetical protein
MAKLIEIYLRKEKMESNKETKGFQLVGECWYKISYFQ